MKAVDIFLTLSPIPRSIAVFAILCLCGPSGATAWAQEKGPNDPVAPTQLIGSVGRALIKLAPENEPTTNQFEALDFSGDKPPVLPSGQRGKEYPFISVRGIFDQRTEIQRRSKLLNVPIEEVENTFYFVDFELERQAKLKDSHQWGKWAPVELQATTEVLSECHGYQQDPVQECLTDPVITMPLPSRITGVWYSHARHPAMAEYDLDSLKASQSGQRLFRLIDFSVKGGETYRYRMKLHLPDTQDGTKSLETGWSNETEPISVPAEYVINTDANAVLKRHWQTLKELQKQ